MTDKKVQGIDGAELRRLAEDQLRENIGTAPPPGTGEDPLKLLHELQVHQIELEMQIVELMQERAEREKIDALLGKYSDLYEFAPVGYFNLNHRGIIRAVNITGTGLLGIERSLLIGRQLDLFICYETRPIFYDFLDKVFASETKETCVIGFLKGNNSPLFVQVEAVVSESREECRAVVIDITERKQAEEYLRQANLVLENSPVVLFRCKTTPEWPVELVSRNVIQFGYTPEEFLSGVITFSSIIHPQDLGRVICEMREYIASGDEQLLQEYRIVTKGGDIRWIIDQTESERNKTGDITHYQGIIFDVTERKLAEEALKESDSRLTQQKMILEELNSALEKRVQQEVTKNQEKDILLIQQNRMAALGKMFDHIAHQWQQPLNSIAVIVQALGSTCAYEQVTTKEVLETVGKIMDIVGHMAQTVDVFKNFYKPDKEKTVFLVKDSIEKALSFVKPAFRRHGIEVDLDADSELSAFGYPKEYAQVLLNILANAKDAFMERGMKDPRISIRAFADGDNAVVTITDNAGGIPDESIGKIFDIYFTTKEMSGGTGIGLYMSKNIIENNMKGKLSVRNSGNGAQFRIELANPDVYTYEINFTPPLIKFCLP